ncbi:hypothetical protein [Neoroseomonas oryzicola]|uniref:Uncharacterized protein n=1 Tax=Neoroseomonas oryzicola TaxID=535904 RepID=A0A9X9WPS9_9PROT|nr:hypothetical protein [Neoroseomonas oryzicola]MBR0662339.1 hypothetical protein [Neoroseomonas oryzicola]NKE15818.1 hypothetical protein [Neoroseomonas oryzicola]
MTNVLAAADPAHPEGGHAILLLQGVMEPPADARFRILREGWSKGTLGPDGWQVGDALLNPDRVEASPQGVRLYLGPRVVDWLEAGPVQFRLPGAGITAPLFWPDVPPLHGGSGHTIAEPAPPRPATPPPPRPAPVIEDADATIAVAPRPLAPPPPPPPLSVPQPAAASKSSVLPWALLLLLLLAAAGGGAYWWFVLREQPAPAPPAPVDPIEVAPEPLNREPPPLLPPVRPQVEPRGPESLDGLAVPEVIARAASPTAIAEQAARRYQAGQFDDALLLWEAAARAGNAASLARLASLYDPVGFQPGRPFRDPDPRQAARLYRDAVAGGDAAAAEPRARLRRWLDDRAREGDLNAPLTIRDFWQ